MWGLGAGAGPKCSHQAEPHYLAGTALGSIRWEGPRWT